MIRFVSATAAAALMFSASQAFAEPPAKPASETATVETAVTAAVSAFLNGFSRATCEDVTPVSRFARDPTTYVLDAEVVSVSLADFEQGVKYRACNWTKHEGKVDSVRVDVLSPTVASAAWTYHDVITLKDGSVKRTSGAVLQTWVSDGATWKVAATKSSERPTPEH